jgi:Glyoxalase/Bleomycin resistance protein/Dioxygenase superfamily
METDVIAWGDVSVHHVGVIVPNIERYLKNSMWQATSAIVHDPLQGARLCLTGLRPDMSPAIELVEPVDGESPVWASLNRGTSWHHICLLVPTMQAGDELMRQHRSLAVTEWKPAVLFDGRPVRFSYSRNRELVEFLSEEKLHG